jgi:hypothetical protein
MKQNKQTQFGMVYLSMRAEAGYNVLLYAVSAFYVEVYYANSINEIFKLKAFKSTNLLNAYLFN